MRHSTKGDGLAAHIQKNGERLTAGTEIRFRLDSSGDHISTDDWAVQNLAAIIQQAVRNAVTHSGGSEVSVSLSSSGNGRLHVQIRDNGRGFDRAAAAQKKGHLGLATMRERAEAIRADLRITTSVGEGTTIEILCPVNSNPLDHERTEYPNSSRR
jgi:NarL family two-component system sensor histidine kinase YdfH